MAKPNRKNSNLDKLSLWKGHFSYEKAFLLKYKEAIQKLELDKLDKHVCFLGGTGPISKMRALLTNVESTMSETEAKDLFELVSGNLHNNQFSHYKDNKINKLFNTMRSDANAISELTGKRRLSPPKKT